MEAERWQRINDLFQAAAERAPRERAAFLAGACGADAGLRREVASLLAALEKTTDFIEAPAFSTAPELLTGAPQGSALAGEMIGRYRVESLLGAGGMGEVYLARDEQLGRQVALKLLPAHLTADEAQMRRLKSEARTASALNHPNILTVYEIGEEGGRQFLATEFIEGRTLRATLSGGRMELRAASEIARQVASALAAAHASGIVHRDIKPENIMLRPDGYAKVLDFGIAKVAEDPASGGTTQGSFATRAGEFLGTAAYVSPEQARGQSADARSDIWSLGVVLYEMIAGVDPFAGATPADSIAAILQSEPPPLSSFVPNLPFRLREIIDKALRKNREQRYQKIEEMLTDLRELEAPLSDGKPKRFRRAALAALTAAVAIATAWASLRYFGGENRSPDDKSIAVLPFADLSEKRDQGYFCEGMQQEVLTRLAKIADLKVISRISTQRYQSAPDRLPEIAKELGVAHILEGTVQQEGGQVRVNVQLIDARNDSYLWAERYDRKLTGVLGVESEIARAIAGALQAKLSGSEALALATRPTENAEAYVLYLRALPYEIGPDTLLRDYREAVALYEQALALDPDFALARAHLASTCAEIFHFHEPLDFWKNRARREAEGALRRRPELGEAHFAVGQCAYWFDQDYERALAEFALAQSALPNDSNIGVYLAAIRRRQGHWEDALATYERMEKLDPLNPNIIRNVLFTNTSMRRWPEAAEAAARFRKVAPDSIVAKIQSGYVDFMEKGDTGALQRWLQAIPPGEDPDGIVTCARWEGAMLERDFAGAAHILAESSTEKMSYLNGGLQPKSFLAGITAVARGESAAAATNFAAAAPAFEQGVRDAATDANRHANLGLLYAFMGRREEAIREGLLGVQLKPLAKDANDGAIALCYLALIYARVGENNRALELIERLLKTPGAVDSVDCSITLNDLRLRWEWDPLRNDSRFQKLLASTM